MKRRPYKSDRTLVTYTTNGVETILGSILTNQALDVDEALNLLGIDMDDYADTHGWSGWDWDDLDTRPDYADGFDWRAYLDGESADACWADAVDVEYGAGDSRQRPGVGIDYMLATVDDAELYAEMENLTDDEDATYDYLKAAILALAAERGIDTDRLVF